MTATLKRTPLYPTHVALKGRLVPFAGWELPIQFSSILAEARAVRSGAGVFDVSHMGRLYLSGPDTLALLEWVCSNQVATLRVGRARYTLLCNEGGGIIDDGIFYRLADDRFLLVCNAANRDAVVAWLRRWMGERFPAGELEDHTEATAMVALQGPDALAIADALSTQPPSVLRPFAWTETVTAGAPAFVGRTGYTGEDGVEFVVRAEDAPGLWDALVERGATPCGLGARDVLRLEAALPLHGSDIDPATTPLEAGLERFVKLEAGGFCGHDALAEQQRAGLRRRLAGFVVQDRAIPRHGYPILVDGTPAGTVTSGTWSPTLERSIGMGYVPPQAAVPGTRLQVVARGTPVEVQVVSLPFYARKRSA